MGDEGFQRNFAGARFFNVAGKFRAALDPAKRAAAPDAPGHQLERAGADFLARTGDTDDDRFAPALVAALQSSSHQLDVADTFKRIVHATIGELDNHVLDGLVIVLGIYEVGRAER
ncbi:hypothetical protein D3C78_982470 [compost metagenome]